MKLRGDKPMISIITTSMNSKAYFNYGNRKLVKRNNKETKMMDGQTDKVNYRAAVQ